MSLLNSGETISLFISFIALIVAIIALVYTAKTFWLKSGLEIRGSYSIASSISTEDKYIAQITLENLKDRAIIIFKIYLRISKGIYLEIDDFDQEPLILKPFEVYYKKFDPIDFYLVNTTRVNFDQLLDNYDIKKEIVLSTSEGKYTVKKWIPRWYLVSDYFKNHFTLNNTTNSFNL